MTMDQNWAQPQVPANQPPVPTSPPPMPSAQPPMPPAPAKKQPGRVGIIIAIILIVASPILIVTAALSLGAGVSSAETYYTDDSPAEVTLKANDVTGIWLEHNGSGYCQVLDPEMMPVPMDTSGFGSQTVNEYDLAATFIPPEDGVYTVICSSAMVPFQYKVAPTMHAATFAICLIAGILALFAGVIVLVITAARRSAWKRNNQTPSTWQPPQQPTYGPGTTQPAYGVTAASPVYTSTPPYGPAATQTATPSYGSPTSQPASQPAYGSPTSPQEYGSPAPVVPPMPVVPSAPVVPPTPAAPPTPVVQPPAPEFPFLQTPEFPFVPSESPFARPPEPSAPSPDPSAPPQPFQQSPFAPPQPGQPSQPPTQ